MNLDEAKGVYPCNWKKHALFFYEIVSPPISFSTVWNKHPLMKRVRHRKESPYKGYSLKVHLHLSD